VICDSNPPKLDSFNSGGAYFAASCSGSCRGLLRAALEAVGVGGRSSVRGVGSAEVLAVGCTSGGPGLDREDVELFSGIARFVRFFGAAVDHAAVMD
jgi:hypothetical protein